MSSDASVDPEKFLVDLWNKKNGGKDCHNPVRDVQGLYFTDVSGDPRNLIYGKPYKYGTAKYSRYTNCVLGLPGWHIKHSHEDFANREVTLLRDRTAESSAIHHHRWLQVDESPSALAASTLFIGEYFRVWWYYYSQWRQHLTADPRDDTLDQLFQARAILSQRLKDDPQNVDLWLYSGRVEEQIHKLLHAGDTGDAVLREFYERALESVPNESRLVDKYIKYTEGNRPRMLRKLVQQRSDHPELWVKYLKACVSGSKASDLFEIIDQLVRQESLMDMYKTQKSRYSTLAWTQTMDEVYVVIVSFVAKLYWESGYPDLAIGILQAVIEYNLFNPDGQSFDTTHFAEFWASESLRVGEPGAKGWKSWTRQDLVAQLPEDWPFALRSVHPNALDKPYRIVLFEDVAEWLVPVTSVRGRTALIWALMNLAGAETPAWRYQDLSVSLIPYMKQDIGDSLAEFRQRVLMQCKSLDNLDDELWAWALEHIYRLHTRSTTETPSFDLVTSAPHSIKPFVKFAKGLLREEQHRNNPRLWAVFARLDKTSSASIFQSAVSMVSKSSISSSLSLWNEWAADTVLKRDPKLLDFLTLLVGSTDYCNQLANLERIHAVTVAETSLVRFYLTVHLHPTSTLERLYAALKRYWQTAQDEAHWNGLTSICDTLTCFIVNDSPLGQPHLLREHLSVAARVTDSRGTVSTAILERLAQFDKRYGQSLQTRFLLFRQNTLNSYLSWLLYQLMYYAGNVSSSLVEETLETLPEPCSRVVLLFILMGSPSRATLRRGAHAFHTSALVRILKDRYPYDHVVDEIIDQYSLDISRRYDL